MSMRLSALGTGIGIFAGFCVGLAGEEEAEEGEVIWWASWWSLEDEEVDCVESMIGCEYEVSGEEGADVYIYLYVYCGELTLYTLSAGKRVSRVSG